MRCFLYTSNCIFLHVSNSTMFSVHGAGDVKTFQYAGDVKTFQCAGDVKTFPCDVYSKVCKKKHDLNQHMLLHVAHGASKTLALWNLHRSLQAKMYTLVSSVEWPDWRSGWRRDPGWLTRTCGLRRDPCRLMPTLWLTTITYTAISYTAIWYPFNLVLCRYGYQQIDTSNT